jgi:hypothetical protein
MSLLALFAAIGIGFYGMTKLPVDYSGITMLTGVFLSAAFGGKVMQKRIEANGAKSDTEMTTRPNEAMAPVSEKTVTKIDVKVDNPD